MNEFDEDYFYELLYSEDPARRILKEDQSEREINIQLAGRWAAEHYGWKIIFTPSEKPDEYWHGYWAITEIRKIEFGCIRDVFLTVSAGRHPDEAIEKALRIKKFEKEIQFYRYKNRVLKKDNIYATPSLALLQNHLQDFDKEHFELMSSECTMATRVLFTDTDCPFYRHYSLLAFVDTKKVLPDMCNPKKEQIEVQLLMSYSDYKLNNLPDLYDTSY